MPKLMIKKAHTTNDKSLDINSHFITIDLANPSNVV